MNPTRFPENRLFDFTSPSLVLYVEDSYNLELNVFIKTNYNEIVDSYNALDIDFCYLPYLLHDKDYRNIVSYNRPYLQVEIDDEFIFEIYKKVKSKLPAPFEGAGLVCINTTKTLSSPICVELLNEPEITLEQFYVFGEKIDELINNEISDSYREPRFRVSTDNDDVASICMEAGDIQEVADPTFEYNEVSEPLFKRISNADCNFDFEAYRLADEIRIRIQQLKETGALMLITDLFEEMNIVSSKLSSLFITNDYRIFLKDYGMKEVQMSPLPKSLYILFLRHPEGILFKQLFDYHDELLSIYRNVTIHEDIDRVKESIRAMTDPLNNSINEKCSRIRAAFLDLITEDLAQNYYIIGKRGEAKKIILDRSLVEFQK